MFFLWLVSSVFAPSILAVNCYHPNGQMNTYAGYAPCRPSVSGGASMCCATNRANFPDECSPDGLCRNGGDIYRDDCTDPTWKNPGCVQLCTTGFGDTGEDVGNPEATNLNYSHNAVKLTQCDDGSYCCGVHNRTCCARGHGKRIASTIGLSSPTSTSALGTAVGSVTVQPSRVSVATAVTSSATRAGTSSKSPAGLVLREKIAIAVSCVVAGTLVAAVIAWFILRKRERDKNDDAAAQSKWTAKHKLIDQGTIHEAPASSIRHELWEREPHAELDGNMRAELKA